MKYLLAVLLVALVMAGAIAGYYRTRAASLETEKEQAALDATRKAREAVSAESRKGAAEIAQWKATAARHEAEARRLRSAASAAAKEVTKVRAQGDVLRAAPADEVIRECARQGYSCRMAGAR